VKVRKDEAQHPMLPLSNKNRSLNHFNRWKYSKKEIEAVVEYIADSYQTKIRDGEHIPNLLNFCKEQSQAVGTSGDQIIKWWRNSDRYPEERRQRRSKTTVDRQTLQELEERIQELEEENAELKQELATLLTKNMSTREIIDILSRNGD